MSGEDVVGGMWHRKIDGIDVRSTKKIGIIVHHAPAIALGGGGE